MGQIVRGLDCHSERLDPLLRGQTDWFGAGRIVWPLWSQILTVCKRLWVETLQYRIVRVGVLQCQNGGWTADHSTIDV